jgi:hypothetical protein
MLSIEQFRLDKTLLKIKNLILKLRKIFQCIFIGQYLDINIYPKTSRKFSKISINYPSPSIG